MKTIKINGTDFSSYSPPYADYTVNYIKVSGQYGGFTLAGTEIEDTIAIKAQIIWSLRPLTDADARTLLQTLRQNKYATIEYYDAHIGATRTVEAIYELPSFSCKVGLVGGDMWLSDALVFRER